MAKRLSPGAIAEKQVKRSQAAVSDFKAGVMAVTESPMKKAAEHVDEWFAGVQRAKDDGAFVDGCMSVTLQDWQNRTAEKGGNNYASGVAGAKQTIEDFHAQLQSAQQTINSDLSNTPYIHDDPNGNLERVRVQIQGMKRFKFKKRRRA